MPDCAADGLVRGGGTKKISSNGMTYIFRRGEEGEVGGGGVNTPMAKAPPKSLRTTHGQGSREWSIAGAVCREGVDCELEE